MASYDVASNVCRALDHGGPGILGMPTQPYLVAGDLVG